MGYVAHPEYIRLVKIEPTQNRIKIIQTDPCNGEVPNQPEGIIPNLRAILQSWQVCIDITRTDQLHNFITEEKSAHNQA